MLFSWFFLFWSCSHDPDRAVQINTNIISLGQIGETEVGIEEEKAVVLTQKELDEELRNLVWLNSQTVFEINNSYPNLRMCLQKKKKSLKDESFPALDTNCLELFEKGMSLVEEGKSKLDEAELKIKTLTKNSNLA